MVKRIYFETVKEWLIASGIPIGTLVGGLFLYLNFIGVIEITGHSGDSICAGTIDDPCYAYINLTAKEDIFIYPVGYDPWGRDTFMEFAPGVKDWKLQRSWGNSWRNIPLDKTCTGTWCGAPNNLGVVYSYVLREGRDYRFRIVAYKNSPYDTIKWAVNYDDKEYLDPVWEGVNEKYFNYDLDERTFENKINSVKISIGETGVLELSKWDNEVRMIIGRPDIYPILNLSKVKTFDNKLLKKESKDVDLEWYFKNVSNSNRLEYDVILKNKVETNIFSFSIISENLDFFYQPPLYLEYGLIEPNVTCNSTNCQGSYRSEDLVGSYAVYHSSKSGNEYMTGKAFHIYRPLIIDANEDTIWGEIEIKENSLTLTVNQEWLDDAVYPVTIDPSFGYTTAGSDSSNLLNYIGCSKYNSGGSGIADSITAYLSDGGEGYKTKCAIYNSTYHLVGSTEERTGTGTPSVSWDVYEFIEKPDINDEDYWLCLWGQNAVLYRDAIGIDNRLWEPETYNSWPDPISSASLRDGQFSIYCNYSEVPPDETPPTYSNNQTNTTIADTSCLFSIQYNDNIALHPNGQYIFSTNNTGIWVNESLVNFTATPSWANITKTLNSTVGISIGYRWYADDNVGNINNTGIFSLTTSADTCTYISGNWNVDCNDNCSITSNVNLGGNNLSLSGVGIFNIQANITNWDKIFKPNGCQINIFSSGSFNK